jgi:hypothetical protein
MLSSKELEKYHEENMALKGQLKSGPEKQWSSSMLKLQKGSGM